jgi:hypothetical protein
VGRKLEVLSAFSHAGQYIVPATAYLLDEVPSEELEQFVVAGCLTISEDAPVEQIDEPLPPTFAESELPEEID